LAWRRLDTQQQKAFSMSRAAKTDNGTDKLRITDQFRTRNGMAYELRQHGARLTVLIAERPIENGDGSEWLVEASSVQFPGSEVSQVAPTRAEALRKIGMQWVADAAARGLPSFDWTAVATALTAVRAI
jgi:hypothetical protein